MIADNDRALAEANAMLEANARVRYGELKAIFDRQEAKAKTHHYAIFEQDYAGAIVRESGVLLANEFHERGLLSDSALLGFLKQFLTTSEGRRLQQAQYPQRQFSQPARAPR